MGKIRAIFFDLDGTLVDAANWHYEAFNMALNNFGALPIEFDEHIKTFNGLSSKRKLEILVARGDVAECDVGPIIDFKQAFTRVIIADRCRPSPRVTEVLRWVDEQKYPITLVTNCSRDTALQMLELSGLEEYFSGIVTNEDCGKQKPHPEPYRLARLMNCCRENEALAVEDTNKGVASAVKANCLVWKLSSFEDLTVDNLRTVIQEYES